MLISAILNFKSRTEKSENNFVGQSFREKTKIKIFSSPLFREETRRKFVVDDNFLGENENNYFWVIFREKTKIRIFLGNYCEKTRKKLFGEFSEGKRSY